MKLDDLEETFRALECTLIALGVCRRAAARICDDAKSAALADLLETYNDRRLVDLFNETGASAVAQRKGISVRSAYARRQEALNRLTVKQTAQFVADTVADKAA